MSEVTVDSKGTEDSVGRVGRRAYRDFIGYVSEYTDPLRRCIAPHMRVGSDDARVLVQEAVDAGDAVVFKLTGCGYCTAAVDLLAAQDITASVIVATAPVRSALQRELRVPLMTFPVVFVKGVHLGGFDQLSDAVQSGRFAQLLEGDRRPYPEGIGFMPDPLRLLKGPRGQPWYSFQLHVYANWIRAVSLVHVLLFLAMIALVEKSTVFCIVLAWIMVADLSIFALMGPTPLAPLSTLVTVAVWRFRGPAAPSLPFKGVMVIYLIALVRILVTYHTGGGDDSVRDGRALLAAGITNSTLLAIFRF